MLKFPAKAAGFIMPLLLSILMTFIVSFVSTLKGVGWAAFTVTGWLGAWGLSWLIAFPSLLLVLPVVKKLTAFLVRP
ncbi:DUF2798 domain-containing protein [Alishewanella tabrizica]|uniref:DUF2798 domain-containing protein n=1 Tax=Alishewanella tabrizica TaxID=671278 RepID=A0ABQ2WNT1_9ALTE|nr:DUF2798 domain-containing protein [Alishewanella tabrizica]GGW64745.1 hypothetical protein GCM10008111_20830 [Alishewanella tabrizica]